MLKNVKNLDELNELVRNTLTSRPCGNFEYWYILMKRSPEKIFDPLTHKWLSNAYKIRENMLSLRD